MTPCARCPAESSSEIVTEAGVIPVCAHCADSWFAMTFSAPMEAFYGEV
jgi:hypothetical protein